MELELAGAVLDEELLGVLLEESDSGALASEVDDPDIEEADDLESEFTGFVESVELFSLAWGFPFPLDKCLLKSNYFSLGVYLWPFFGSQTVWIFPTY